MADLRGGSTVGGMIIPTTAKDIPIQDAGNVLAATNVEDALQELFTFANSGKTPIANAITGKGISASPTDSWATLANKISQIKTGVRYATGTTSSSSISVTLGWQPNVVAIKQTAAGGVYGGFWLAFRPTFQRRTQVITGGDGYYVPYTYDYPATTYNFIYMTYNGSVSVGNVSVINSTGFSLNTASYGNNGNSFTWYAWE
jgi:hypothetical protein